MSKIELQELIDHSGGWNWEDQHVVQAYLNKTNGITTEPSIGIHDIIEAGTVLIAAGPSDLDTATDPTKNTSYRVVPIGLIESAQVSLNKPLSRIFEIGSKLSYIIPGRTVGGIALSRVFFDGPSILKAMYFGEVKADYATQDKKYTQFISSPYKVNGVQKYEEFANIGSGNLAMNLASSFFDQPIGLAFFFKDNQTDTVGQTYFEGCRISTYNMGISAGMNVLTESINLEFVRVRPILTTESWSYTKGTNIADINIVSAGGNKG
jgi:hypothetical protein